MPTEELSTTTPLTSQTIDSLSPIYSLVCADVISDFQSKKAAHKDPGSALVEGAKLKECIYKSAITVKETPCSAIHAAYKECLMKGKRVPCAGLKSDLEECAIKHIGKLD